MQLACRQLISGISQHLEISIVGFFDVTVEVPKYDSQQVRLNELMQPEFALPKRILGSPFPSYVFDGHYNKRRTLILYSRNCDSEPQKLIALAFVTNHEMVGAQSLLGNCIKSSE